MGKKKQLLDGGEPLNVDPVRSGLPVYADKRFLPCQHSTCSGDQAQGAKFGQLQHSIPPTRIQWNAPDRYER